MEIKPYTVYVKADGAGRIVAIGSDAFLADTDGWTAIDSGHGDKYHHAQGHYLPAPIMDERGVWRYKLADGAVAERTAEEMEADAAAMAAAGAAPTDEEAALMELAEMAADADARLAEHEAALVELAALIAGEEV